ncbi:MAG: hypothetical protein VB085_04195 [Peptococcaceae bacterium]|nr:hypothetical protein [Peptococcaceae bacterium]
MKKTVKSILSIILMLGLNLMMILPAYGADFNEAETKAKALKKIGLFHGVSVSDFDLDRAPTRTEALIMLIRLLGKETEVQQGDWAHSFTDVASWADKYVAYGCQKDLAQGVSSTEFGTGSAGSDMYLTFMLQALGYSASAGDFNATAPADLAAAVGILPDGADTSNFLREDAVLVSWAALEAQLKDGSQKLAEKLTAQGLFTGQDYALAVKQVNEQKPQPLSVSSLQALKTALADKTVRTISIDSLGTPLVVTGELTIPAGVTVTVNRGNDFYIEGSLTNNGALEILGADSFTDDFINYSVMAVQKGGKVINNGRLKLCASVIGDEEDRGPVGGQLRVFDGTFENKGSLYLEDGGVNTHGGMALVAGGAFTNGATVVMKGFFFRIENGSFINNAGAVVINGSHIYTKETGTFTNNGTLSGAAVNQ